MQGPWARQGGDLVMLPPPPPEPTLVQGRCSITLAEQAMTALDIRCTALWSKERNFTHH